MTLVGRHARFRNSPLRASSEAGQTKTGVLLSLGILGGCVWAGFQIIPFYYCYYELQGLMQSQADIAATTTDEKIRKVLLKRIKELGIPIRSEDELRINRFNNKIEIDLKYTEVLYVDLGQWGNFDLSRDLYTFEFHPRAERVF